ncbi:MAG: M23 family metallopeptidase [Alphaproteobacteria bacterium]
MGVPFTFEDRERAQRRRRARPRAGFVLSLAMGLGTAATLGSLIVLGLPYVGTAIDVGDSLRAARGWSDYFDASHLSAERALRAVAPERTFKVGKGDTILDILLAGGASPNEAHEAIAALKPHYDPRKLKPGQELTMRFAPDESRKDRLRGIVVPVSFREDVSIERSEDGTFAANSIEKPVQFQVAYAGARIESSLYEAGLEQGVPAALMAELFKLYSYDVDFQREIQPGDDFEILFERYVDNTDQPVHTGAIAYAQLTLSGKRIRLFRFTPQQGEADYFNEKGESVKKALLRTPVDGARLSSRFGQRLHPILGYTTMHRGVDFAAPEGTPVMAAGAGTVEMAGSNAGYGNYVRLRHTSVYATAYAHLSGIARGVRHGVHVAQGQVIGYIGTTGLSTGPHLHYEVLFGGTQINPTAIKMPSGRKLEGQELARFRSQVALVDEQLRGLPEAKRVASR